MNKIHCTYLKKTYIITTLFATKGKLSLVVTHCQLCNSLSYIKKLINDTDKLIRQKEDNESIIPLVFMTPIELEKVITYNKKLWEDSTIYLDKHRISSKCWALLDDYHYYKVLVSPCIDELNKNRVMDTVQSVSIQNKGKLDWYKIPHSNIPIKEGTKNLAIYKCNKPLAYDLKKNIVTDLKWPK